MIAVLSLNPSTDVSAALPRFCADAPNRIRVERRELGGKGVNVARALRCLGAGCVLIGFDFTASPVSEGLDAAGVSHRLVPLSGALRTNLKIREEETGRMIEISEAGAPVSPDDLESAARLMLDACRPGDWAVLTGSLPPGADADTYGRLCARLKERGCRVAADCDGEALRRVIPAGPELIKPNAQEFRALTSADPADRAAAEAACQTLIRQGVQRVCLSLGAGGARLYSRESVCSCPAAPVKPLGLQGAGDALLAGLLAAMERGCADGDALRFASAAAGAAVMRPGTLSCRMEDVTVLLAQPW